MEDNKQGLALFLDDFKRTVTENYAQFKGRASRGQYWRFMAVNVGLAIIIALVEETLYAGKNSLGTDIYSLLLLIPTIAISVRRLHDINKSGWMYLVSFIPLLGTLWLLYLHVQQGVVGTNKYGEDPLA